LISKNEYDDFKQISYVNGLETYLGGTHIDYIIDTIVYGVREKLRKKVIYKNIKPGDIKNKLMVTLIAKGMKNVDWDGQTKASITSPVSYMKEYFKTDFDKLVNKIVKTPDLIDNITEFYKIKAEAKERQELKKMKQKKRKIRSEKYLPSTGKRKYLLLCEGASAVGGLLPSIGRDGYGFFELKGVPLNAYDASHQKFTNNKELSELFSIIQNEEYEYIVTATDADADGQHIKGLLMGFFIKYLPEYIEEHRFGELRTPVQAVIKNKKIIRWIYDLNESLDLKKGETGKYYKGLGSWKAKDLEQVIKTDGVENMVSLFNVDDDDIVDDWLSSKKADKRKEYIQDNVFDITGI
jgi:DNA topoisomerase-2